MKMREVLTASAINGAARFRGVKTVGGGAARGGAGGIHAFARSEVD